MFIASWVFTYFFGLDSATHTKGFKHVSVGKTEVWAVTDGGAVIRRIGISGENPAGAGWDIGIAVSEVRRSSVVFTDYVVFRETGSRSASEGSDKMSL